MSERGRGWCLDEPEGIRHLVDSPRAKRCDQHRDQRHRWSDANGYRRRNGREPLPWIPDPLTPERRKAAVALRTNEHGWELLQIADTLDQSARNLEARTSLRADSPLARTFFGHLQSVANQADRLRDLAERMGHQGAR